MNRFTRERQVRTSSCCKFTDSYMLYSAVVIQARSIHKGTGTLIQYPEWHVVDNLDLFTANGRNGKYKWQFFNPEGIRIRLFWVHRVSQF